MELKDLPVLPISAIQCYVSNIDNTLQLEPREIAFIYAVTCTGYFVEIYEYNIIYWKYAIPIDEVKDAI